ncbi:MAG: aldehyde dehydrogenase [Saprospiraceae bacterium]|jgi:aminomuconate-semialdehyde/2-hydroxymuconate-6-semialdehyde dehydrogenase|nr:aldehyde dehydrogenase [Saprospiraceae bacterium]MBP9210299.1 aldehyde dehydrogenase [Saprospiraceae bacterium]
MDMRWENFIGGGYRPASRGLYFEDLNPATGNLVAQVARSGSEDLQWAIDSAKEAFGSWSKTSPEARAGILYRIGEGLVLREEEFALAETLDTGKPIAFSRSVDIPRAAANFRFFAAAATQFASEAHEMPGRAINYTLRQPVGIVGCIAPWNLPLYLMSWKIAPALAAGNCVVAKPSEFSPVTAAMLGEVCNEAGLPPGVLSILQGFGSEIGEAIVDHPDVKAISFTGGTQTGARIASRTAPAFKKISLELGGKNPCIVFADCDYPRTLREIERLAFSNSGQICLCGSRILVEQSIYERLSADLVNAATQLHPADPLDPATRMGALISEPHLQKVHGYVEQARSEGGRILCGGQRLPGAGAFYPPTLIDGLGPEAACNREEIFGPVATLQPFATEEEALELANHSAYGLAATLWTENLSRAHRMASALQTGIVWVNTWLLRDLRTPFGGVKHSGTGREGGWEAMRFFTEPKNVCINFGPRNA